MMCVERLCLEISERAFVATLIAWPAMVIGADLSTVDKLAVAWGILVGHMVAGVLGSFVGNRCSASLLPDPDSES